MYREIDPSEIRIAKDSGYQYFIDRYHPLATGNSFRVYLHRHIASISKGYWIPAGIHVHHINGNKLDNTIENLEVLSASEHAQKHFPSLGTALCLKCGAEFSKKYKEHRYCSQYCSSASSITKTVELTKDDLDSLIPNHSWVSLGRIFGMSDTGIRKRAIALGCNIPIRRKRT